MVRTRRKPKPPRKPKLAKAMRWRGEADPTQFQVKNLDGTQASPNQAIVPIAKQFLDGTWALVGTGFFISRNGLVATARHVATDVIDQSKMQQTAALGVFQFQPNNHYIIRSVLRVSWHNNADVAVLTCAEMRHNTTKELLMNPVVTMRTTQVRDGESIFTYAYPKSRFEKKTFNVQTAFFDGRIEEFLPDGRDRTFLPNPCYRTSMHIHGGASGGPVFDADGAVFGINSTGFDGTDISYISRVNELLPLEIQEVIFPGEENARSTTIAELVERGLISVRAGHAHAPTLAP